MKILFINTGPWGTGSFTVIKGLAKEMRELGHQVKVFFPDANFESIDKEEYYDHPEYYRIWQFPINNETTSIPTFPLMITDPHPRNPNAITFKNLSDNQLTLYLESLQSELKKLINEFKPDIIECHHIWYASSVINRMNLEYLVVAHNSDQLGFRFDRRAKEPALASAAAAKIIIAVSEHVKQEVMRLYHVKESKIITTTNGYDSDVFKVQQINKQELLKELGIDIDASARIVSFAGKISKTKGIDILLRANKLLDPKLNIHFIIMGCGNIDSIANKLEPNSYRIDNMHFIGHQTPEMLAKVHNIAELTVMPSRTEGFGIACLEGMGCGLPAVVTRCGGPENFAVGKIIDKVSPEQLAEAIVAILELAPSEYKELSQEALKAAKVYSWKNVVRKHMEIYQIFLDKNVPVS